MLNNFVVKNIYCFDYHKDFHSDLLFLDVHCTGRRIAELSRKLTVHRKKWNDLLRDSAKTTNWLTLL